MQVGFAGVAAGDVGGSVGVGLLVHHHPAFTWPFKDGVGCQHHQRLCRNSPAHAVSSHIEGTSNSTHSPTFRVHQHTFPPFSVSSCPQRRSHCLSCGLRRTRMQHA